MKVEQMTIYGLPDYPERAQPKVDKLNPLNWDFAHIERAYLAHYSKEFLMAYAERKAQPMVEKYHACWMMLTDEGEHHYGLWCEYLGHACMVSMQEEDKLYIRELELLSLGGC